MYSIDAELIMDKIIMKGNHNSLADYTRSRLDVSLHEGGNPLMTWLHLWNFWNVRTDGESMLVMLDFLMDEIPNPVISEEQSINIFTLCLSNFNGEIEHYLIERVNGSPFKMHGWLRTQSLYISRVNFFMAKIPMSISGKEQVDSTKMRKRVLHV